MDILEFMGDADLRCCQLVYVSNLMNPDSNFVINFVISGFINREG